MCFCGEARVGAEWHSSPHHRIDSVGIAARYEVCFRTVMHRASLVVAFGIVAATGCVTEAQIQADFDAHVAENSECTVDAECVVIWPGCPLGCFAAVHVDAADECISYANGRIDAWEAGGQSCVYDCIGAGEPYCDEGRCAVDPIGP